MESTFDMSGVGRHVCTDSQWSFVRRNPPPERCILPSISPLQKGILLVHLCKSLHLFV